MLRSMVVILWAQMCSRTTSRASREGYKNSPLELERFPGGGGAAPGYAMSHTLVVGATLLDPLGTP